MHKGEFYFCSSSCFSTRLQWGSCLQSCVGWGFSFWWSPEDGQSHPISSGKVRGKENLREFKKWDWRELPFSLRKWTDNSSVYVQKVMSSRRSIPLTGWFENPRGKCRNKKKFYEIGNKRLRNWMLGFPGVYYPFTPWGKWMPKRVPYKYQRMTSCSWVDASWDQWWMLGAGGVEK